MNAIAVGKVRNGTKLMIHAFRFDYQYWKLGAELFKRGLSEIFDKSE